MDNIHNGILYNYCTMVYCTAQGIQIFYNNINGV